jgi:acetoin utilization protein AcuB
MNVASVMTEKVFKVTPDDSIGAIREILAKVEFHHLLVVEDDKLVGIVSDRDILKVISPLLNASSMGIETAEVLKQTVNQIMSKDPITVKKDTPIKEAADLVLNNKISCLPVVSKGGKVDGILSWKDILRALNPD